MEENVERENRFGKNEERNKADLIRDNQQYHISVNKKIVYESGSQKQITQILRRKDHTNAYNTFAGNLETVYGIDPKSREMDRILLELKVQYPKTLPEPLIKPVIEKEPLKEGDLSVKTWEQLKEIVEKNLYKRINEFLIVLSGVVSLWFAKDEFFWVLIIGVRSVGKTKVLKCFLGSEFTYKTDVFSLNSPAPGWARKGDKIPYSMLDECKDKTFVNLDLTAPLGERKDKKTKLFKEFSNAYDPDGLTKFSPGAGNRTYGGRFNFVGAITPKVYYQNVELLEDMGRFLKLKFDKIPFREKVKHPPDIEPINYAVIGFLRNLKKRFDKQGDKIAVSQETKDYLMDVCEVYEQYIRVFRNGEKKYEFQSEYELEEPSRRYYQILTVCKAKAFVENRKEVSKEDVDFFKPLLWGLDSKSVRAEKIKVVLSNKVLRENLSAYKLFDVIS